MQSNINYLKQENKMSSTAAVSRFSKEQINDILQENGKTLENAKRTIEKSRKVVERSEDIELSHDETNKAVLFAQGILSGWAFTNMFTTAIGSFMGFWSKKGIQPIKSHQDTSIQANFIATGNAQRQQVTAIKVERSWLMCGLGAALMIIGTAGNAVAPGASNLLTGIGASLLFGAPFIDSY